MGRPCCTTSIKLRISHSSEWMPNATYGGHAFGLNGDQEKKLGSFEQFYQEREKILPWIKEYSPYELVTTDDPPVALYYADPPAMGQATRDPTHSANYGVPLQEKCKSLGVECDLIYKDAPNVKHLTAQAYLIEKLKAKK